MGQIVKYSDIKVVGDIVKTFASLPMEVNQDENGKVTFSIADYPSFLALLANLTAEYDRDFIVTKDNVGTYEKEAAQINKLSKFIKDGAKEYVMSFARELLGVTAGKNRYDGQVQMCEKVLKHAYDNIHTKTVAFREEQKRLENIIDATDANITEPEEDGFAIFSVCVPKDEVEIFKRYLAIKKYEYKEVKQ